MYAQGDAFGWEQSSAFKKTFSTDVDVEFLGVWCIPMPRRETETSPDLDHLKQRCGQFRQLIPHRLPYPIVVLEISGMVYRSMNTGRIFLPLETRITIPGYRQL